MKVYLPLLLLFLYSCNQKPKHPQAALINQRTAITMTEQDILQYADSLESNTSGLEKQVSLVYQIGEDLMYAEQYSWNGNVVIFKEYINNEGLSRRTRSFYLKNDSLIMVRENNTLDREPAKKYEENRSYIRNNIIFKKETRTAGTAAAIKTGTFTILQTPPKNNIAFTDNITQLKDAIYASNKFEVLFDNIIPAGDESRIILKSKLPDGYQATVVVNDPDPFIDSLLSRPSLFKDKKLNIRWRVMDKEAIYVPVAASITSASGLNR